MATGCVEKSVRQLQLSKMVGICMCLWDTQWHRRSLQCRNVHFALSSVRGHSGHLLLCWHCSSFSCSSKSIWVVLSWDRFSMCVCLSADKTVALVPLCLPSLWRQVHSHRPVCFFLYLQQEVSHHHLPLHVVAVLVDDSLGCTVTCSWMTASNCHGSSGECIQLSRGRITGRTRRRRNYSTAKER